MKRVLLTSHKFFPEHRAGTEVLTLKIAQELQRRGMEVMVVACDPPDLDAGRKPEHVGLGDSVEYDYQGVPVHIVTEALRLRQANFDSEYYHPLIKEHFAELIENFKPDLIQIVHAQNLSASIIEAAREAHVPVVFYSTDFWFVCPIVQLKRPDGSVCRGPGPGGHKCLDCYTPRLFPEDSEVATAVARKLGPIGAALGSSSVGQKALATAYKAAKWPAAAAATTKRPDVLRDLVNKVDRILVPTRLMQDIFIENGIDAGLMQHLPFGIDTSGLVGHRTKKPSESLRIGFIGTFFEHKGVDLLIKAFHELPLDSPAVLKLYGSPDQFPAYFAELKTLAESGARAADISFPGTFPNEKLGEIFEELDVLVVPSRWYENTPLVMQSALATRTPLIATDLGGMSELIEDGVDGLLFKLNDWRDLADKLALILHDRELLRRYTAAIKPDRTVSDMVDDIQSVYESVWQSAK